MQTRIDRFKVKVRMRQLEIHSFRELAKAAGISEPTMYNAIDSYKWHSHTLDALAAALKCNPIDLLTADKELFGKAPTPATTMAVAAR